MGTAIAYMLLARDILKDISKQLDSCNVKVAQETEFVKDAVDMIRNSLSIPDTCVCKQSPTATRSLGEIESAVNPSEERLDQDSTLPRGRRAIREHRTMFLSPASSAAMPLRRRVMTPEDDSRFDYNGGEIFTNYIE